MPQEDTEVDYTTFKSKPATPLQAHFPEWIMEKCEIDPAAYKTKADAFREGVRLGTALRMQFQASPENRQATAERRAERAAAAVAQREESEDKPAKRGRPAAAPVTEEPVKPTRRGRAAKADTASAAAF